MARRKKVGLYLDEKQVEALKKISDKTKIPQATIVREGVDLVIQKYQRKS